jgi:membrane dipeptidase
MDPISRRRLLKLVAGSLALAACQRAGLVPTATSTQPAPAPTNTTPATGVPSATPTPAKVETHPEQNIGAGDLASLPTPSPTTPPPELLILDAHEDIAWNAIEYGRDPLQSALDSRDAEAQNGIAAAFGERVTGLPQWNAGHVGIIFASIYVQPIHRTGGRKVSLSYSTPEEAEAAALREMDFYHTLVKRSSAFRLVTSESELDSVLQTRQTTPQIGLVLLMEGADPILDPSELEAWQAVGLRIIGPAWAKTRYSGGNGEPGPLTDLGRFLLQRMAQLNLILDLSHMSEPALLEALDTYTGPLLASHANPRLFLPTERGLTDEMIMKLAAKDGVTGIVPVNNFLLPGWSNGDPPQPISKVADALDYVAQLTGSARYAGLGTDYDGGFGPGALPQGMSTIADLPKIADTLASRGWSAADVRAAMVDNFLRVLRRGLLERTGS